MKTITSLPLILDFNQLEAEWGKLNSIEDKELFWQKTKKLLEKADKAQVDHFFEQLNLQANQISESLERASTRAKAAGFSLESTT